MICLECQADFKAVRRNQRFCSGKCKNIFHGKERKYGLALTTQLKEQLQSLAEAHGIPINEMACLILQKAMNPDGRILTDEEIYGEKLK